MISSASIALTIILLCICLAQNALANNLNEPNITIPWFDNRNLTIPWSVGLGKAIFLVFWYGAFSATTGRKKRSPDTESQDPRDGMFGQIGKTQPEKFKNRFNE